MLFKFRHGPAVPCDGCGFQHARYFRLRTSIQRGAKNRLELCFSPNPFGTKARSVSARLRVATPPSTHMILRFSRTISVPVAAVTIS